MYNDNVVFNPEKGKGTLWILLTKNCANWLECTLRKPLKIMYSVLLSVIWTDSIIHTTQKLTFVSISGERLVYSLIVQQLLEIKLLSYCSIFFSLLWLMKVFSGDDLKIPSLSLLLFLGQSNFKSVGQKKDRKETRRERHVNGLQRGNPDWPSGHCNQNTINCSMATLNSFLIYTSTVKSPWLNG